MATHGYADRVRAALKGTRNRLGRPLSIGEFAHAINWSYEHCRKVVRGEPVVSEEFNRDLCALLALPTEEMWRLAQLEKARRRFGAHAASMLDAPDRRLAALWPRLSDDDRDRIVEIARSFARLRPRSDRQLVREGTD